jgi:hypothetical protein
MENAGIFNGNLEYFTAVWCILWPVGNVVVIWYIFPLFGILCQEKSGNPGGKANECFIDKSVPRPKKSSVAKLDSRVRIRKPRADPTTFEFTATTPAL